MKPKLPVRKEAEIQKGIIAYLRAKKHYVIRMNTGLIKTAQGNYFKQGVKGMADILVIKKENLGGEIPSCISLFEVYWVEVKRPGKGLELAQQLFRDEVIAYGHHYILAHGIKDVEEAGI